MPLEVDHRGCVRRVFLARGHDGENIRSVGMFFRLPTGNAEAAASNLGSAAWDCVRFPIRFEPVVDMSRGPNTVVCNEHHSADISN